MSTSSSYDEEEEKLGTSSSGTETGANEGSSTGPTDQYSEMQKFLAGETHRVKIARRFVVISLLVVGCFVSTLVYMILRQRIDDEAADAFELFSSTIEESFKFQVSSIFSANRALSHAITSSAFALNANFDFPHFAVPAFESIAYEARLQGGFEVLMYAPSANQLNKWLQFTQETRGWLDTSKELYDDLEPGENRSSEPPVGPLPNTVWDFDENGQLVPRNRGGFFTPILHVSPPPVPELEIYQNINLFSNQVYREVGSATVKLKDAVFSPFDSTFSDYVDSVVGEQGHERLHSKAMGGKEVVDFRGHPHSVAAQPVYKNFERKADGSLDTVIGYIFSIISWDNYLVKLLPEGVDGMIVILRNSCNQSFTYEINGPTFNFIGVGDLYEGSHDSKMKTITFEDNYLNPELTSEIPGHCQVFLEVHSSSKFEEAYASNLPVVFTCVVGCLFLVMACVFSLYDSFVQHRNRKILGAAARSNAIVSQVFPTAVREKLMAEAAHQQKGTLKGFLTGGGGGDAGQSDNLSSQPIADFFPETTVLFADIAGFTAWSSVREPAQVFRLLETLYFAFDEIAKRRRIFKVETVGDCYVAVCGLPEARKDHAVNMARFAQDCMNKVDELTKKLEVTLGPDTGDLTMRMGLHSGPVTAGVLRGERSRFQLFGDTMNTASRMESTGQRSRIQVSQETADQLIAAKKDKWLTPREDKVHAKGKGYMQTYWLNLSNSSGSGSQHSSSESGDATQDPLTLDDKDSAAYVSSKPDKAKPAISQDKINRLIDWNTDILTRILKQIVARRRKSSNNHLNPPNEDSFTTKHGALVIDEVAEIIALPHFDSSCKEAVDPESVQLTDIVIKQLRDYVTSVSALYRNNPFHNFEHASHVTMSVVKLLSRIVAPSESDMQESADASMMHDHTYGITSDPLTQFSCVLSAIIHDLDHPGVPNARLCEEKALIASIYKGKSIAEQNSVDIAWQLLMDERFQHLRATIYSTDAELKRFRQLIVNSVMATDIVDKELKALRNARWEKAFSGQEKESNKNSVDRKATIVIEHLIQASDVAHTMQHWHIYRKWNERFFLECYKAYKDGHADTDPSINWYKGEMGFFDFYIIPLARKLKDCGVFGVSCDEYLQYALRNREEWELRGEEVVTEMVQKVSSM